MPWAVSLWHKRAGVEIPWYQPMRAKPQLSSTNESGPGWSCQKFLILILRSGRECNAVFGGRVSVGGRQHQLFFQGRMSRSHTRLLPMLQAQWGFLPNIPDRYRLHRHPRLQSWFDRKLPVHLHSFKAGILQQIFKSVDHVGLRWHQASLIWFKRNPPSPLSGLVQKVTEGN